MSASKGVAYGQTPSTPSPSRDASPLYASYPASTLFLTRAMRCPPSPPSPSPQVTFVGKVKSVQESYPKLVVKLDDGTSTIECTSWSDDEAAMVGGHVGEQGARV